MQLVYEIFSSPLGELLVAGNDSAVIHVTQGKDKTLLAADFLFRYNARPATKHDYVHKACMAITRYLEGKSAEMDIDFEIDGTEFQCKVWDALLKIPYGKTRSYSDIAHLIGKPGAFRAVANACGDNPVPLLIPCHRVVHKSGNAVGFGWGKEAKYFLLNLEKKRSEASLAHAA